jgi:D-alanyl-D-alanine carboxypeptidase
MMAVAGKTGTLREMFLDSPLEGILVGKTGTLNGVKALAGYVPIDGDDPVRFVLLLNKPGIDNKSAYRPVWALLGDGLRRASAGPRTDDLAP